ncbi:ribonuclease J [Salinarimonas ramus]|uniref:RNase J family beta-CASP ribonuclease n=1 Tax=Salinarimonas ramus TaxID=690164 RepID=A0A917QIR8_9HYPH|nr:ribonuclease J [Salinarimonas ramus]GGK53211.1 RNase J family beta-CASP ribonuclease [Salinarimonas ramus]
MVDQTDELVFLPLGGLGEIGMNAALYGYGPERTRRYVLVDCGVSFAGEDAPGVDLILPDLGFIEKRKDRLDAIFITHAHEDHIGALIDMWPRLGVPVYMTRFAASLLEARRLGEPGAPKIDIRVVKPGVRTQAGPFSVEYVPVAHSIPESNALAIRTPAGLVVHTGDWKIDPTPTTGEITDETLFRALGDEGVIAAISDSTNVLREGFSPSESEVADGLAAVIEKAPHRVAITTFASNVARIRAVAMAAERCGRQVVVVGRAMERVVNVARELGYLDGVKPFLSGDVFDKLPRDKVVAILTGSQGEPRAALARIAREDHPFMSLAAGDQVVFSSRQIPGNEKAIGAIMNALAERGIGIVTADDGLVHVSGHPRRGEMRKMYEWLRPACVIPAHGEAVHLAEHARFARENGVPKAIVAKNGAVVRLAPGTPEIVDHVKAGQLYKDGNIVLGEDERAVPERRKLAAAGIVTVAIAIDARGEIQGDPAVDVMGLPLTTKGGEELIELVADAIGRTLDGLHRNKRRDSDFVETAVARAVRSAVNGQWGKKPACHVLVVEV